MSDIAIRVENLSKQYKIGGLRHDRLKDLLTHQLNGFFSRASSPLPRLPSSDMIWALKDVSFEVKHGETLGVIGANGAGKSTLLKILSRITEPTSGRAEMHGRVGSLLEVGTGFDRELTGRENTYLNGAILGMTKREIDHKFDEIVDFSGVEKFLDTPVKWYSSGMYVRLAFAVAAHLEPEILIVDEVLAVGDVAFQRKCLGKMEHVAKEGRTVLFVSHNMAAIQALCHRAILLEHGSVKSGDKSVETIASYLKSIRASTISDLRSRRDRQGNGSIRFVDTWLENVDGERVDTVLSGQDVRIVADYEALCERPGVLSVAIAVKSPLGDQLSDLWNESAGFHWPDVPKRGRISCTLERLPLNIGHYSYNICGRVNGVTGDWVQDAGRFTVEAGDFFGSGMLPGHDEGYFLFKTQWGLYPVCVE